MFAVFDEKAKKKNIEEHETGSEILKGRNILLAEDNDLNAEIAEAILENAGMKVAVDIIRNHKTTRKVI